MEWPELWNAKYSSYDKTHGLILGGAAVTALILYKLMKWKDNNLPPGPRAWPIIGSLGPRGFPIMASIMGEQFFV